MAGCCYAILARFVCCAMCAYFQELLDKVRAQLQLAWSSSNGLKRFIDLWIFCTFINGWNAWVNWSMNEFSVPEVRECHLCALQLMDSFVRTFCSLFYLKVKYNYVRKNLASPENAQILNFPALLLDFLLQNSALLCFGSVLKKRGKIQNLSIF